MPEPRPGADFLKDMSPREVTQLHAKWVRDQSCPLCGSILEKFSSDDRFKQAKPVPEETPGMELLETEVDRDDNEKDPQEKTH